jgi:hypothetical protein
MPKEKTIKRTCNNISKEITEYPKTNVILYTDGRRSYQYVVKMEGLYPQPSVLAFSQGKNKYKIPDCYCVETTWGRGNNKRTVKCSINYVRDKPHFRIMYGLDFSEEVCSNMSSTAAANAVVRVSIIKFFFKLNFKYYKLFIYFLFFRSFFLTMRRH